ncbi:glycosyltransferase [Pseudomonas sp. N040]|nr:glycosyltransferase [Pseudomonas sp. N040]
MSCLHVVASIDPKAGGPSRTVVQLTDALADDAAIGITLLSQGLAGDMAVASSCPRVDRRICESRSRVALRTGLPLRKELLHLCMHNPPSLIHSHGLWLPVNHWASRAARQLGIPLIIHPRGMLEPWAINHKSWKKKLAMAVFQRRDLDSAAVLMATSEDEYQNFRSLGLELPVAVIPNGIQLHIPAATEAKPPVRVRKALFLSRVHQKKGLLNLVQAWATLQPQGWRLQIAGPDEGGHLAEVMAAARKAGIETAIDYLGEVDGAEKAAIYHAADLFVLPTFSENFGVVVAEALAHGLPVITTQGAPWAELVTHGCGWWVAIGVEPLEVALRQALALSDEQRVAMGERGKAYVQRYDWVDIAQQTAAVYRWLLGQQTKPDNVRLD